MTKQEIIKIIENYSGYVDRSRTEQALSECNFEDVAKEILKKIHEQKTYDFNR